MDIFISKKTEKSIKHSGALKKSGKSTEKKTCLVLFPAISDHGASRVPSQNRFDGMLMELSFYF